MKLSRPLRPRTKKRRDQRILAQSLHKDAVEQHNKRFKHKPFDHKVERKSKHPKKEVFND